MTRITKGKGQVTDQFDRAKSTEEIRRIILTYPELIDHGDIEGVAKFLDGVKMCNASGIMASEVPEEEIPTLGHDDVRSMCAGVILYDDGLPHTRHIVTNIDVWFSDDGRRANSRSFYVVLQALPNFPLQIVITGRYEDTYEFDSQAWKLRVRREYADIVGDLSRHLKPATR
jgi:hypothetical protein